MTDELNAYNVSFILTNSVVIVTVETKSEDLNEIIEEAATIAHEVDGLDVSRAQADVEEAYV